MSNKINELSPTYRDNLLRYNLAFADSVNTLSYLANGIGKPIDFYGQPNEVQAGLNLLITGDNEVNQISNNKYIPNSLDRFNITENIPNFENIKGGYYLNGYINGYEHLTKTNIITGVLSGDTFLDIHHTSLATFLSVSAGLVKDTDLGEIGSKTLWKLLGYRTLQNTYKQTVGKINLNISSLLSGDDFLKADYKITRKEKGLNSILEPVHTILGLESPNKKLSDIVSFNSFENPTLNISNESSIIWGNSLLLETGRGQGELLKKQLESNLDEKYNGGGNRYIPNYKIDGEQIGKEKNGDIYSDQYVSIDKNGEIIDETYRTLGSSINGELAYNISNGSNADKKDTSDSNKIPNTEDRRFRTSDLFTSDFNKNKKSLLDKTLKLFNENKIKSIIYNKGTTDFDDKSDVLTGHGNETRKFNGKALSRGAQYIYMDKISSKDGASSESNVNNYFCRSWVNGFSYDRISRLQKHRGLDPNGGIRNDIYKSVLDDNGFVKITPTENNFDGIKKYMFSIENLAWANDLLNLPEWEIGNGDPMTGTRGRIMWFPPYELTFSESTSVNYDTYNFIGRSEPMYTYNNSERTGQISFKIIIDHPQYMNNNAIQEYYGDDYEDAIQTLIAGCGELPNVFDKSLSELEKNVLEVENAALEEIKSIEAQKAPESFNVYFPNDVAELLGTTNLENIDTWYTEVDYSTLTLDKKIKDFGWGMYEMLGSEAEPWTTFWGETRTGGFTPGNTTNNNGTYLDRKNYGLNAYWRNKKFLNELSEKLKNECPACKVYITGYASVDGETPTNKTISDSRSRAVSDFLAATVLKDDVVDKSVRFGTKWETIKGGGESGKQDGSKQDSLYKKKNRYVKVSFKPDLALQESMNKAKADEIGKKVGDAKAKLGAEIKKRFFNEAMYFKMLHENDKTVFDKFSERIKYFSPAFHSITPEGFNSRLTFLQQCTRQGSTILENSNRPNNMSFGMPPVCILRLGDFWHTKIIIDSLNIDYEQMWDINPEGVGVQPMIATVSLSFKMLGGSSMAGPINKLQNAVSFNYYANTQMFDPRSDYFSLYNSSETLMKDSNGKPKLQLDMQRGKYVNGVNDLYSLLGGKYTSSEKMKETKNVSPSNDNNSGLVDPNIDVIEPINSVIDESNFNTESRQTTNPLNAKNIGNYDVSSIDSIEW